ncbi:MAG: AAA family ATPase, partial [Methanothrix sp.]|nr:AAA family ATPase [Methanothrix sp.]
MAEGITRITVKGFKSIADEISIEIRPLTILAGANSSGKSSIMQPLLMMKQTLEAPYDPGPLLIDGPNVRFTSAEQFLSRMDGEGMGKFSMGLEVKSSLSFIETFVSKPQVGMEIAGISYKNEDGVTILRPDMKREEIIAAYPRWRRMKNQEDVLKTDRRRCFLELKNIFNINSDEPSFIVTGLNSPFSKAILSLIHVPALRGNPERNYKKTSVGPMFPGTFEIYAASIIHHWQTNEDTRLNGLGTALEQLGLTWMVSSKKVDDVSFEVMVGRFFHNIDRSPKDLVSIADVGFGISQILPVIVALLTAGPGQLVYIEQPEIHLHPLAQTAMAQILADAANRGVKVVAETHSSLLLLGIQSLVAEGKLSPDKVKLHWFKRRPEDGVTEVSSADLD